jgi:tetratricopeptide (TPR) repeat protein
MTPASRKERGLERSEPRGSTRDAAAEAAEGLRAGRRRTTVMRVLVVVLTLGLALFAVPRSASAEDAGTKAAKRYFAKGEKLFALGRFDEALEQYEKAFESKPLPGFLFNIAQCHRNLGNIDQAIFSYRKYLREAPDAENREAVERQIEELEEEKARTGGGGVVLRDPPLDDRKPPKGEKKPIYARWWFWGGVAAVAGAGAGTYFLTRDSNVPSTDLGNVVFD